MRSLYSPSGRILACLLAALSLLAFACPVYAAVEAANENSLQSTENEDVQIVYDPAEALIEQTGGDVEAMEAAISEANATAPTQSGFTSDMPQVPFVVDIIDKNTTVVIVVDEKKQPISGATVKIKGKNSSPIAGRTGVDGKVKFDMRDLNGSPAYTSIEVSKDDYRTFETQELRFTGGSFRYVSLVKDSTGQPYFSQMDFDKWDFQYTKNDLPLSKANDATHTFRFVVRNLPNRQQPATVRLIAKGGGRTKELSKVIDKPSGSNTVAVEFTGEWCNPNPVSGNSNFPFTDGQTVTAVVETGGRIFSYTTNMTCKKTVLDAPLEAKVNMSGFGSTKLNNIKLPDSSLPVLRGAFGDMPVSGFEVFILPSGRAYIGINMELDGKFKNRLKEWKTTPEAIFADWEAENSKLFKAMKAAFENKAIDYQNPTNNFMKSSMGAIQMSYDVAFYSKAFLVGRYEPKSKTVTGEMTYMGGANVKMKTSMSVPFKIFTITIGFDTLLNPELSYVSQMKNIDPTEAKQTKAQLNPKADITLAIKAEVGISGSAGIPDVASAGARGFMFIQPKFEIKPNQSVYQRNITLGIGVQLKAEIAMFTFTKRLWGKNWTYDNKSGTWKSKAWWFDTPQSEISALQQEGYAADELTNAQFIAAYQDALNMDPFADEGEWNATSPSDLAALGELDENNNIVLSSRYDPAEVQTLSPDELTNPVAADYGQRNKIMPKSTTKIASNVYSDSKVKIIFSPKQKTHLLFRIVMVDTNHGGSLISVARLAYSEKTNSGWSAPKVLCMENSAIGYEKYLSDYDFDLFAVGFGGTASIMATVVSGFSNVRAPENAFDNTSVFEMEIVLHPNLNVKMTRVAKGDDNVGFHYISMAYTSAGLVVYVAQEKAGLGDTGKNAVFLWNKGKTIKIGESDKRIISVKAGALRKGDSKGSILVAYLAGNDLAVWDRELDPRTGEWKGDARTKTIQNVSCMIMPRIIFGIPIGGLLYVKDEKLYNLADFDHDIVRPNTKISAGAKLSTWTDALTSAEFPCWFENVEGQDKDNKPVADYTLHLLDMTAFNGNKREIIHTPGYIYSNLAHAVDCGAVYCSFDPTKVPEYGVVYTHTTNTKKQQADLYDAKLQSLRSVDILGMSTVDPCIVIGKTATVNLQVQNLGNVPVKGFTVKICADAAGKTELTSFTVVCKNGKRPTDSEEPSQNDPLAAYMLPGETLFFTSTMNVTNSMGTGTKKLYAFVKENTVQSSKPKAEKTFDGYKIVESDGKLTIIYSDGFVGVEAPVDSDGILEAFFNTDMSIFDNQITYEDIPLNSADCPQACDVTPSDFGLGHDDLELTQTTQMIGDEEYVSLRVFNDATLDDGENGFDVGFIAEVRLKADIDGNVVNVGTLQLKRKEGATITLPLSKLTGGKPYDYILFSAETDDEFNEVDNTTMLGYYPVPDEPSGGGAISGYTGDSGTQYPFSEKGVWQKDGGLRFKLDVDCEKLVSVLVDGKMMEKKDYTVICGSTIIILHKDYLATLSGGEHTLCVSFTDGKAETTFFANKNALKVSAVAELPATGGNGIGAVCLLTLACAAFALRRRIRISFGNPRDH